jgi:cyclase
MPICSNTSHRTTGPRQARRLEVAGATTQETDMRYLVAGLGVIGLLALTVTACGGADNDTRYEPNLTNKRTLAKHRHNAVASDKKSACLADPPVIGANRQVFRINDHLMAFYDGRNTERVSPEPNWVDDAANKLGVATYAIHQGDHAIVFDTFPTLDQAAWQRRTLEAMGIKRFTVVLSHWHNDHIAGNAVYADSPIIMTATGLKTLTELKDDIEAGTSLFGPPAIKPLVLPTQTYEGSRVLHVGDIRVELRQVNIHSPDETVILIPADRILLSGDTTEDTETYIVEFGDLKEHVVNLKAMRKWDFDRILPNHGDPNKIKAGGYDKSFIDATTDYVTNLINGAKKKNFLDEPLEAFIGKALGRCDVSLFEPYREVHEANKLGALPVWGKAKD